MRAYVSPVRSHLLTLCKYILKVLHSVGSASSLLSVQSHTVNRAPDLSEKCCTSVGSEA